MKHTPGPWTVLGRVIEHGATVVGQITVHDKNYFPRGACKEQALANARLIAAAPELLEALESLFAQCAMVHKHWGDNSNAKAADEAIKQARAAIAKATREED